MTSEGGVLLVSMPFGPLFSPSIGVSLLKAGLAARGITSRIRYYSIRFAERVGRSFYRGLSAEGCPSIEELAGEWIFSYALFPRGSPDDEYVDRVLRKGCPWPTNPGEPASAALIRHILRAREQVDDFLRSCLEEVRDERPRLVGFSSMFQQHAASLALARLIKQALPETFVVFGGANCEDVMGAETVRQFPFVDAAVSGEADLVFPELARRVLEGQPIGDLPGVRTRDGVGADFARGCFNRAPLVGDLDALPYPDYRDYFEQFEASRFGREWQPRIPFETSRGCWWGEKLHCSFCGLNGQAMAFRSKSAGRAIDELVWLTKRHPGCDVDVTDSILDMRYFETFVPALKARALGTELSYEVKANLKKEHLRMLRDAGIRSIQPGIESFSDPVLKLMRKGVSTLQSVQLLKWCKELAVEVSWNLLWGFPGEPPEEYARMARLVPLLSHLPPPEDYGMIRLDRFSPNFDHAGRLGFEQVRPLPSYSYVYPLAEEAVANLAYFFTFTCRESRDVEGYVAPLVRELRAWYRCTQTADLFSVDTGESLLIWDLRAASRAVLTVLRGVDRILYRACDSTSDVRRLAECLAQSREGPVSMVAIERRLAPLLDRGLLVQDGSRYLALAVPLGEYSPPASVVDRFYALARALGTRVPGGWVVSPLRASRPPGRISRPRVPSRRGARRHARRRLIPSQFSVSEQGDVLIWRNQGR